MESLPDRAGPTPADPVKPAELERVMGPFASFAISLATICILSGGITSFHVAFCGAGGAAVGLGWPLCGLFSLTVALTMGHVASAFPRAGGPYQWAALLGGRGWGWLTAWFGLAGLVTGVSAVNVGTCRFVVGALSHELEYHPESVHPFVLHVAVIVMTLSHALINHYGIRLTSWLTDAAGYLILVTAAALTAGLLWFGVVLGSGLCLGRLVTLQNFSGTAGGDVYPETASVWWLFLLGLLLPAYTITGIDAPAQTAEETLDPRRVVPRGIVRGVLVSGLAGWVLLCAVVLAAPDLAAAARAGEQSFLWIVRAVLPYALYVPLMLAVTAAMYLCGLATLTAASRLAFAFARDGGLPCSRLLRRIGTHHTPSAAIWTTGVVAALFAVGIAYETIAAVCAIYLYLAYVLPTGAGLWAYRRRWTRMGPWHLGRWYRPLAVVCVLGCIALIVIGLQPPNEIAVPVVGTTVVALLLLWVGYMRRHFPGPPPEVMRQIGSGD